MLTSQSSYKSERHPKERNKCLETSLLNEVKSLEVGNTEAGMELSVIATDGDAEGDIR